MILPSPFRCTSDEALLLQQALTRLFAKSAADRGQQEEEQFRPTSLWTEVEDLGLPSALRPPESGGYGFAAEDVLTAVELAGRFAVPLPIAETMFAGWLLAEAGLALPPGVFTGAAPTATGLTIARAGAAWSLTGTAVVPWGRWAQGAAVILDTDKGPFLVVLPSSQWSLRPQENMAGEPMDLVEVEIHLEDNQVAPLPKGLDGQAGRAISAGLTCLLIAGSLRRVLELTVEYAQSRHQFGRPIASFQAIQQNLALLAEHVAAATAIAANLTGTLLPRPDVRAVAAAKIVCGDAIATAASLAHQIHGAIGFSREYELNLHTRRLWSWRDQSGSESEWAELLGRECLDSRNGGLWPVISSI